MTVHWHLIVFLQQLSMVAAGTASGSFYSQVTNLCSCQRLLVPCATSPPNRTMTRSKGFCSSACNSLASCRWFNYIENDMCDPRLGCDVGMCQLFTYKPVIIAGVEDCTLWQMNLVQNPIPSTALCPGPVSNSPVLVQQSSGSATFDRVWSDYKNGFGSITGDYWMGNEQLHRLSSTGWYKVRIDVRTSYNNQWYWAEYSTFTVASETDKYRLTVAGYTGNAGDCWRYHSGSQFATKDKPDVRGCATSLNGNSGGFWYMSICSWGNINGSPSLFSSNDIQSFNWQCLPVGSGQADRFLQTSRVWLICK